METFTELNLNPSLVQSITRMHFKIPTPIQAQAIPPALLGKDILGNDEISKKISNPNLRLQAVNSLKGELSGIYRKKQSSK